MSELMKTVSDRITVTDTETAEQIVTEYRTCAELTLKHDTNTVFLFGEWIFAVEHESNAEQEHGTTGEPIDNLNFIADIVRVAEDDELPFTITEICEGSFDIHPGRTRYTATKDEITIMHDDGGTRTEQTSDYGIITNPRCQS